MKKILILSSVLALNVISHKVQAQSFQKGDAIFSIGFGTSNPDKSYLTTLVNQNETLENLRGIGVLHFKGEYALSKKVGFGLVCNYGSGRATLDDGFTETPLKRSSLKFNLRTNIHFSNSEKFDPYIGAGIGWGIVRNDFGNSGTNADNPFPLGLEGTIGLRGYLKPNIAIYGELGLAKSFAQLGASYRLRKASSK